MAKSAREYKGSARKCDARCGHRQELPRYLSRLSRFELILPRYAATLFLLPLTISLRSFLPTDQVLLQ